MSPDWDDLLLTFHHDPPGKSLDVRGHEGRSAELASVALRRRIDRAALHADTRTEDQLASLIERVVPLPTAGPRGERAVGPAGGRLTIRHPLSGADRSLEIAPLEADPQAEPDTLRGLVDDLDPPEQRFLAVWRFWRDRLAARHPHWALLPADTRLPDHTIWQHLDTACGLRPSLGQQGVALLSFSLGPVQSFIAAARTVRDLWTGSYLLSWLTFAALRPVLDACGPAAVVTPHLRGNPLLDRYLRKRLGDRVPAPDRDRLLSPCLPNRFVAFVPWGREGETAEQLAQECRDSCQGAWMQVCADVQRQLDEGIRRAGVSHADGWDRLWPAQVKDFFEVRTVVLPFNESEETLGRVLSPSGSLETAFPDAFRVRGLRERIPDGERPGDAQDSAGRWMARVELLGRLAEAARARRHVPAYEPDPGRAASAAAGRGSAACWAATNRWVPPTSARPRSSGRRSPARKRTDGSAGGCGCPAPAPVRASGCVRSVW